MRITISTLSGAGDADGTALASLYGWLRRDEDVNRTATIALAEPEAPTGAMDAMQLIEVGIVQITALVNLATACLTWRRTRATPVKVEVRAGNQTVVLDGSPGEVAKLRSLFPDPLSGSSSADGRSDGSA